MSNASKTHDADHNEQLERRRRVADEKVDGSEEDRRDGALIDEAWRQQAGRPLIGIRALKRQLGLE